MRICFRAFTFLIAVIATFRDVHSQERQQVPLPRRVTLPEGLVLELRSSPDTAIFRPALIQSREHHLTREHVLRVAPQVLLLHFAGLRESTSQFKILTRTAATAADTGRIYAFSGMDNMYLAVMTDSAGRINEFSILR